MSGLENTNGASGERGKEHLITLMHPQASIVAGQRHFFPFGKIMTDITPLLFPLPLEIEKGTPALIL